MPNSIHQMSELESVAVLKSTPTGLSQAEAERRLREDGPNQVDEIAGRPPWVRLVKEFFTFSLLLWIAAALAFFAAWSARAEIARLSFMTAVLAVIISLVFFSLGRLIGIPMWKDFIFAIGIIVAMVPEGLLPTLTLALVLATQRMAQRHVLIRYLPSVEKLGSTTVICTDKTGTLTLNRMSVQQL